MSNESLSALFDGECTDGEIDRLLAQMDASPELAQRWGRWQLTREIQEGTRYTASQPCICASVMAGLEEPVKRGTVVDLSAWRRRVVAMPWKPMVGFAAAASMGAAAVLFVVPQHGGDDLQDAAPPSGVVPSVRVSNPETLPGYRKSGLQAVSLNGNNPGPILVSDDYVELLRNGLANRSNGNAYTNSEGTLSYAGYTTTADIRPVSDSSGQR